MSVPFDPDDRDRDDDKDVENRIKATTNVPPDPPLYAMAAGNTGIALLGAAAIWFCLKTLHEAFLLTMTIIIALAIGNLVLLAVWLRREAQARAAMAGETQAAFVAAAAAAARAAVMAALPKAGAPPEASTPQTEPDRLRRQAAS